MDQATKQRLEDGQRCLEAALDYLKRGWSVLALCHPEHIGFGKTHTKDCQSPGKRPWHSWKDFQDRLPTEREVRQWWKDHSNSNVGVALGPASGLIRIDVEGEAGEKKLAELSGGDLPATLEFVSGRKDNQGRGLLYRIPEGVTLRTTIDKGGKKEELRLQAKGAQTVLPPSRHESGNLYQWKRGHGPNDMTPALAPDWLIGELSAAAESQRRAMSNGVHNGQKIIEGARNDALTSLAGTMRRRGMSEAALAAALLVENEERCDPPLSEAEVKKIAWSVSRYEPEEEEDETPLSPPDYDESEAKPSENGEANSQKPEDKPPELDEHDLPEAQRNQLVTWMRARKTWKEVTIEGAKKYGRKKGEYDLLVSHKWTKTITLGPARDVLTPRKVQAAIAQAIGVVIPLVPMKTWKNDAAAIFKLAGIGEDCSIDSKDETLSWLEEWTGDYPSGHPSVTVDVADVERFADKLKSVKTVGYFWDQQGRLYIRLENLIRFVNLTGAGRITRDDLILRLRRLGFENKQPSLRRSGSVAKARVWISPGEFEL